MKETKAYILVWILCSITVSIAIIVSKSLTPLWALFIPALFPYLKINVNRNTTHTQSQIDEKLEDETYLIEEKLDELEEHFEEKVFRIKEEVEEEMDRLKDGFDEELDRLKEAFIREMRNRYSQRVQQFGKENKG